MYGSIGGVAKDQRANTPVLVSANGTCSGTWGVVWIVVVETCLEREHGVRGWEMEACVMRDCNGFVVGVGHGLEEGVEKKGSKEKRHRPAEAKWLQIIVVERARSRVSEQRGCRFGRAVGIGCQLMDAHK